MSKQSPEKIKELMVQSFAQKLINKHKKPKDLNPNKNEDQEITPIQVKGLPKFSLDLDAVKKFSAKFNSGK